LNSTMERARAYHMLGLTLRAVGLMQNVVEIEPTSENLLFLADLFAEEGLFEDSAAIHLELVKAGLKKATD
jgi:hypothetical protein